MSPNPIQQQRNSRRQKRYTEERAHYESLISLIKYSVTIVTGLITLIGIIVGYLTYANNKDLKEDFREQKHDMQDKIAEMKLEVKEQANELKSKEQQMTNTVEVLLNTTQREITETKNQAINHIGSIKGVATAEARNRIDEVFKAQNFDGFVENVAEKRIEPKIKGLVDERWKRITRRQIDFALEKANSESISDLTVGLSTLQTTIAQDFTDDQIQKLIDAKNKRARNDSYYNAFSMLLVFKSPTSKLTNHFKHEIESAGIHDEISTPLAYLTRPDVNVDLQYFQNLITNSDNGQVFFYCLETSLQLNKQLFLNMLNSKPFVDEAYKKSGKDMFWAGRREGLLLTLKSYPKYKPSEYLDSYFFKYKE